MDYTEYVVGQRVCSPSPDVVQFDMTDGGAILAIKMSRPTQKEKAAFRQKISFRFVVVEKIIMILARLGNMQWMDAPYYRYHSTQLTNMEFPDDGQGLAVHAMLIDASTGVLVAQKLIGLDTDTSRALYAAIGSQPVIPNYNWRVASVQRAYTTNDLVREWERCRKK